MNFDHIKSNNLQSFNPNGTSITSDDHPDQLVGFSSKIHDPSFAKYQLNSIRWAFLFTSILAIIAIIGFPIYGIKTGEIDWPNSLFYGIGIGGMFIVIAGLQTLKRKLDKTWDGVVIDKQSYRKRERSKNGHIVTRMEYVIKIKKNTGGVKKHKWVDTPGLFNYYNVGDQVRHHKGFFYYEKYDKSTDLQIICIACNSFNDITQKICNRCKCPLLK